MDSANAASDVLDKLLCDVVHCAEEAEISIWLECGTLLGFVRDQDYIPWEDDLDFGAFLNGITKHQRQKFGQLAEQRGYRVIFNESYWHISVTDSECHADINLYSLTDDGIAIVPLSGVGNSTAGRIIDSAFRIVSQTPLGISEVSRRPRDRWRFRLQKLCARLPRFIISPLERGLRGLLERVAQDTSWRVPNHMIAAFCSATFRGIKVDIPENSEKYLAYRYGDDWQVPRQAYDTWKEDGAIV